MTRLLAVYDGNNALVMRFEYADARMPFAMTMSGAVYYLAYDQVGSLRVVADGSGNPVKRIYCLNSIVKTMDFSPRLLVYCFL